MGEGGTYGLAMRDRSSVIAVEAERELIQGQGDLLLPAERNPSVSLVICTLNEEKNLPYVLARIPSCVSEVLIVDGRSTDRTVEVAKRLYPGVRILTQPGKGKGDALRHGLAQAAGDVVVAMDADGSMDPGEIPRFVDAILRGHDLAKGTRFSLGGGTSDMPPHRVFGNRVFTLLTNVLHGCRFRDLCYGYFALRRDAVARIPIDADGFEVETQIFIRAKRAGLRICEVPSYEQARLNGDGHLRSLRDGWRILRQILTEFVAAHWRRTLAEPCPAYLRDFRVDCVKPLGKGGA